MKIHLNIMNNKHLLIALGLLLACNHATYAQKGKSKEAKTPPPTAAASHKPAAVCDDQA